MKLLATLLNVKNKDSNKVKPLAYMKLLATLWNVKNKDSNKVKPLA